MDGSNARAVFGLSARGHSLNGWPFRMKSKALFVTKEAAEAHIAEFRRLCTDEAFFECAQDDETLRIQVVEFELFD